MLGEGSTANRDSTREACFLLRSRTERVTEIAGEPSVATEAFGYKQELKRSLGLLDLLVYGLVFIVPTAPIAVFGFVYNASRGMVPLVYVVGLVAMLFTASSYAAMARAIPVSGSVYAYAGRAIGESAGFIAGWALLLDYLLLPALVYMLCAIAFASMMPGVPQWVWMIGLLAINTVINLFGIESTARISLVLLALQIILLVVFAVAAIAALMHGTGGAHLSIAPLFDASKISAGLIFNALSLAVLSFLGFDAISTLAEEAHGGGVAVGKATMLSLVVCAVLFVAQTWLISLFVLGKTSFPLGRPTEEAAYTIAATIGGGWLKFLVSVVGIIITGIPGALTAQAATSRLLYSMARDGKLPRFLAYVSPTRKVPDFTILAVGGLTLCLFAIFYGRIDQLTQIVNFGALTGFLLIHASVVAWFLWRQKSRRFVRYLLVPLIGFAIIAYVLINMDWHAQLVGGIWLWIGLSIAVTLKLLGTNSRLSLE
jgi:amino acid transporter